MQGGSISLFRVAGIQVSLHFSWFLVAVYQLTSRPHGYEMRVFAIYEYLALFLIVLLHEFGHAFACRQVGGIANRILLWPFGGVAFVRPPPRPGAELWSIAAGPLVNVALFPLLLLLQTVADRSGMAFSAPDAYRLVDMIRKINIVLLVFNLLPIYPLDGGQILRSLLWYPFGRIRSLQIASVIGLLGGALLTVYAFTTGSIWLVILTFFLLTQAVTGWQQAKALRLEEETLQPASATPAERPPVL
ncbi:MAG TPA: site-2 protease family protein [Chthoniobacterales bacterium]|nr:site-2 protease family protein [Chthoniobacterales bacterium]